MKFNTIILCLALITGLGLTALKAQETLLTAGGHASGSGGSVSYSVGQVVYTTATGTNGSVAQGVQQAYMIVVETGLEEVKDIHIESFAFPNPVSDFLTLITDINEPSDLSYHLFDADGRLIENKRIEGKETIISMENLSPAIYYIKVMREKREIKSFKIIKN